MSAVRASISVALKGSGANGLPDRADPQRLCRAEPIPRGSACRSGALLPRRTADDHCQRHPAQTVSRSIAGCQEDFFQNGDLDFDGSSYISDWPDGSPDHPTSLAYIGPFTNGADTYPQIQFETNGPASEILCNVVTGAGCTVPPVGPGGPTFYPFWTLGNSPSGCVWNFGNVIPGQTVQSFGGAAEYGAPDTSRFAGTFISPVMSNPQLGTSCQPSSPSAILRHALARTAKLGHLGSGKQT